MTKSEIISGICGFKAVVKAAMEEGDCNIEIESDCGHLKKLSEQLKQLDPYHEISFRDGFPLVYEAASKCLPHAACPVPCGIIKAIEVEAKLALPKEVSIKIIKE